MPEGRQDAWETGPGGLRDPERRPEEPEELRRKRRSKEKDEEKPKPEPVAERPNQEADAANEEALETAVTDAETAREVAIAEVVAAFPPELRYRVEQALASRGGEWSLERGRYLYTRLLRTERHRENGTEVAVTERFALRRDDPPRRPDPETVARLVAAPPPERPAVLDELRTELAPRDELEISIQTAGGTETIRVVPERPTEPVSEETAPPPDEPADVPHEDAAEAAPEGSATPPERPATFPPAEKVERVIEHAAAELYAEPEPVAPEMPEPPVPGAVSETPQTKPAKTVPSGGPDPGLGALIEAVTEAVDERTELPPIAGGEAVPPKLERREPEPHPAPSARPRPAPRPSRESERRILDWERRWYVPERKPDREMRRKARKLVRVLAREYGLRLTPRLEAYLLGIILAPRIIGGRKVYGLTLNREALIRVLEELWLHFPAAAPRR